MNVERVAFDPLAAEIEPAQIAHGGIDGDAVEMLKGVDGAHLIRDRADAADARGEVGGLARVASAQERFKEARGLEDFEAEVEQIAVAHAEVEGALPFGTGQVVDLDGPTFSPRGHPLFPARAARSR